MVTYNSRFDFLMNGFTGYFDASGSDETVAFVVGGCVATESIWVPFSEDWKEVLDEAGVDCFHMREFAHSTGRFSQWKGQEDRRHKFISALIKTINRYGVMSFTCGVLVEDYEVVNREYPLRELFGSPYALCGESCLAFMEEWINNNPVRQWPEMIFDQGDRHRGELMQVFELWGLDAPMFKDKSDLVPLQAADLVAWENLKVYRTIAEGSTDLRESIRQLRRRPHHWKTLDMRGLLGLTEDEGIPKRSKMPKDFIDTFRAELQRAIGANRKQKAAKGSVGTVTLKTPERDAGHSSHNAATLIRRRPPY